MSNLSTTVVYGTNGENKINISLNNKTFNILVHKYWTLGDYVLLTAVKQVCQNTKEEYDV